jgi:iron-sulfur cluster repair protein YtfE (RIC family)
LFHEHHQAEDNELFPALRRGDAALDEVIAELARQHIGLAGHLTMVLEHVGGIRRGSASQETTPLLTDQLRELKRIVEEHLVLEERTTIPVVRSWSSWPV